MERLKEENDLVNFFLSSAFRVTVIEELFCLFQKGQGNKVSEQCNSISTIDGS